MCWGSVFGTLYNAVLSVVFSLAFISPMKSELIALIKLRYVVVRVLLFLGTVDWSVVCNWDIFWPYLLT